MNNLRPPMMEREQTPPPYIQKKSKRLKKVPRCYDIKALAKEVQEVAIKIPKIIDYGVTNNMFKATKVSLGEKKK